MSDDLTAESAINEINGYISYLEDIPEERLIPHLKMLERTEEHLKKLRETLNK